MILRPQTRPPEPLRVAQLADPQSALAEDGELIPLNRITKDVRVFAPWDMVDALARAGHGELVCWGDDPIRWRHEKRGDPARRRGDVVIVKLPYPPGVDFLAGIGEWRDWLADENTNPGWSLGGTSMRLLRATLERELVTTNGQLPEPRWTLGGRQHCAVEPGTTVAGAVQLDLPAAYSTLLGGLRYGGSWRRLERPEPQLLELLAANGWPLLCRASVSLVGSRSFGPLPRRPRRRPAETPWNRLSSAAGVPFPLTGRVSGVWTWQELEEAARPGARVRVAEAWAHSTSVAAAYPFAAWLDACKRGRGRGSWFARLLAKATANALWGQFVLDDAKTLTVQRWNGSARRFPVSSPQPLSGQRRGWDLGELVCGQVRAKLYRMMETAGPRLVCAHTDGGWIQGEKHDERLELPREWKLKDHTTELQVLDQQKYRYRDPHGRWRYTFSGTPAARAAEDFERLWEVYAK